MASEKILVIDDVLAEVTAFEEELSLEGYQVDFALSGKEGVKMVEKTSYALIFIDYIMPEMDGMATSKAINNISPDSEIVLMTGKVYISGKGGEKFFRKDDKTYFLNKPLEEGIVLKIVREVLDRRKTE